MVWALPLSIATTKGITICFLFLQVLRCFSSLGLPLPKADPRPSVGWVSPFGNPRIKQLFAPPRGLSQLITSFIVFESQGIHRTPLFTFFNKFYKLKNQLLFQHVKELFPLIRDCKNTRNRTVFFSLRLMLYQWANFQNSVYKERKYCKICGE
jgi:hypothetical protein